MELPKFAIFVAASFEAEPLAKLLQTHSLDFTVTPVGIGAIAAATGIEVNAQNARGRHAVFVGTCGSFAPFTAPELITPSRVLWLPTCERAGLSYSIPDTTPEISCENSGPLTSTLREAVVVCAPNISLSALLPASLDGVKTVENVELYCCYRQLKDNALTLSVVLATTNEIGKNAHQQWKANHKHAAQLTADYLGKQIRNFAMKSS